MGGRKGVSGWIGVEGREDLGEVVLGKRPWWADCILLGATLRCMPKIEIGTYSVEGEGVDADGDDNMNQEAGGRGRQAGP